MSDSTKIASDTTNVGALTITTHAAAATAAFCGWAWGW